MRDREGEGLRSQKLEKEKGKNGNPKARSHLAGQGRGPRDVHTRGRWAPRSQPARVKLCKTAALQRSQNRRFLSPTTTPPRLAYLCAKYVIVGPS